MTLSNRSHGVDESKSNRGGGRTTRARTTILAGLMIVALAVILAAPALMGMARGGDGVGAAQAHDERGAEAPDSDAWTRVERLVAGVGEGRKDVLQRTEDRLRQTAAEHAGPWLERWIIASRDEALADGTAPVPPAMREMLLGFFPQSLLDRVRYRVGWGSRSTLQGYVFGVRDTKGITLGDVIVFRDAETAADPLIWAHELAHVQQYDAWGLRGFAERYMRSFDELEGEAWRVHGRYKSWAQRNGLIPPTDPATMWDR